jgi:hypothetical protein
MKKLSFPGKQNSKKHNSARLPAFPENDNL